VVGQADGSGPGRFPCAPGRGGGNAPPWLECRQGLPGSCNGQAGLEVLYPKRTAGTAETGARYGTGRVRFGTQAVTGVQKRFQGKFPGRRVRDGTIRKAGRLEHPRGVKASRNRAPRGMPGGKTAHGQTQAGQDRQGRGNEPPKPGPEKARKLGRAVCRKSFWFQRRPGILICGIRIRWFRL
jgi:hypothetical protein